MDGIEFSKHALERMRQREITQNQVRTVIGLSEMHPIHYSFAFTLLYLNKH